jgi:hypothetical protein
MAGYAASILPQHRAMLTASAITPEVATERGYVSVDTRKRLESAGFQPYQRKVPGLLIPVHDVTGTVALHQYRADAPRRTRNGTVVKYETPGASRMVLDVPPRERARIGDPHVPLWITEGVRKADAAVSAGLCCVALLGVTAFRGTNKAGGKVALADWESVALNGRQVYVCFDSDVMLKREVHKALVRLGAFLARRGAAVAYVYLPAGESGAKTGLDDYLAAGGAPGDLVLRARAEPVEPELPDPGDDIPVPPARTGQPPPGAAVPQSLAGVEKAYAQWLHDSDPVPTRAVLAAYAANMYLPGDPVWLMLVGGSGIGKTERLLPVTGMPGVIMTSSLTGEAALLSATPARDRAANATGGLLRQVGGHGLLVLKDFTSVLSMSRDERAKVLAALREVYDGRWDRPYGADGGQTLTWTGKCGLLAGCTTAIDSAHSVLDKMGTRFVFVRLPRAGLTEIGEAALAHMGREEEMRARLAEVTAGLLSNLPGTEHPLDEEARQALIALACLASQARSPVQRDSRGELELVLDAEAPTRIIKELGQLWRGAGLIGLTRSQALELVTRVGLDSIPKLRGAVLRHLAAHGEQSTTEVAHGVDHPSRSVRRALEDLTAHGVVVRIVAGQGKADSWALSDQARGWHTAAATLPEMAKGSAGTTPAVPDDVDANTHTHQNTPIAISGTPPWAFPGEPVCVTCAQPEDSLFHAIQCLGEDPAA